MSFDKFKSVIEAGDKVFLFLGFDRMHTIVAKTGEVFQTQYGALKHSDVIGSRYGSRIPCAKGYVYALHPTPELWTNNLPHRTQILYTTDISMVTMQLDLKPGAVVVESGTGSGSLSHSIIRTIAPTGHLYTFEFHEQRAKIAEQEFKDHKISQYVTVKQRDVCAKGFDLDHVADAVFLDLPTPWEAVRSAKQALKLEGGRLCSFSPCIEQVQRTCEELTKHDFGDITTIECLVRNFDIRTINLPQPNLGYNINLPKADLGKLPEGEGDGEPPVKHMKTDMTETGADSKYRSETTQEANMDSEENDQGNSDDDDQDKSDSEEKTYGNKKNTRHDVGLMGKEDEWHFTFKTAGPPTKMPGHTGFLTFATLYPV